MARRPRVEDCERLSAAELRPWIKPGARSHRLADGSTLRLRWSAVRGCWGGQGGTALVFVCPSCSASARVLRRPPGEGWSCRLCRPVSFPSHRRSGARRGHRKPSTWHHAQITQEQQRIATLLGLAHWPPAPLLWGVRDLAAIPLEPDAPRLSEHRRQALLLRLDALETLRYRAIWPTLHTSSSSQEEFEQLAAMAQRLVSATAWAMRRPPKDPRTARKKEAQTTSP
jgi:hypothetical protein